MCSNPVKDFSRDVIERQAGEEREEAGQQSQVGMLVLRRTTICPEVNLSHDDGAQANVIRSLRPDALNEPRIALTRVVNARVCIQ